MRILKIYENFYLRNFFLLIFFIGIIFCSIYIDFFDKKSGIEDDKPLGILFGISRGFVPIYLFCVGSNILLVKKLFINRRYLIFFPLLIIYWVFCHILLVLYFGYLGFGSHTALTSMLVVGNGTGLYFLHLWILKNIRKGTRDMINMASELSFLKQQLNPHFLLNAMNNLYGEALSSSDILADRILNLACMLRYQIEASRKNLVSLEEEINFIKQYIAYYEFSNECLEVEQNYLGITENIELPPLFFLPLVENAIKFSSEADDPNIKVNMIVKDKDITFSIQNNCQVSGSRLDGTGIGIENLKRRLEVYGLRHELIYGRKRDVFKIKLKIWGLPTAA